MVAPQNIPEAALILARSAPYFPPGSVHVVVVDPGVGTARRPLAAKIGTQYYVGPDNGTITGLLERAEQENWPLEFVHLTEPRFWLENISYVFHGRDIFSPVAAHLSVGVPLAELGTRILNPVRLNLPKPERKTNGWRGEIIHIDHFGNLASNLRVEHLDLLLARPEKLHITLGGIEIQGLVNTFGERPAGELIALFGSTGNLIVSVVNGSAAARLNAKIGDSILVEAG
jgi:S-adenosylmethionine hydrolase